MQQNQVRLLAIFGVFALMIVGMWAAWSFDQDKTSFLQQNCHDAGFFTKNEMRGKDQIILTQQKTISDRENKIAALNWDLNAIFGYAKIHKEYLGVLDDLNVCTRFCST
jgi:hypothetical protein